MVQGGNDGRDHHNRCFSLWLAGGGTKPGTTYGSTDDLGFNVAENTVHVHDLNATLLHLLGLEHTRLTYRFQGRDYRLTDIHGNLVQGIMAQEECSVFSVQCSEILAEVIANESE